MLSEKPIPVGIDLDMLSDRKERPTVLIVDDDRDTVELLKTALRQDGLDVLSAMDGYEALSKLSEADIDLVLLDLMMPQMDGWETFEKLRTLADIPVVIISAKGTKQQVIDGLEAGVDDYVTKPFHLREVVARVRAVLRRSPHTEAREVRVFPERELVIDINTHHVTIGGQSLELSPNEFKLLNVLAEHAPRPAKYEQIALAVWGVEEERREQTKYLVYLLRQKLSEIRNNDDLIATRTGIGYQLKVRA